MSLITIRKYMKLKKKIYMDPSIKKMMDNALIYTIYIKSNEK